MAGEARTKVVGHRLQSLLEAKGWRKAELITRSGLKPASVYEWLRGESEPRGHALSKLAHALEVSTDYLLGSDPIYDDCTPAQVAARESLRVCLRELGVGPGHPEYVLYEELARSDGAPRTVKGWHGLIQDVLPRIAAYLRAKPRSHGTDTPRQIRPLKRPGILLAEEKD